MGEVGTVERAAEGVGVEGGVLRVGGLGSNEAEQVGEGRVVAVRRSEQCLGTSDREEATKQVTG